MSRSTPLVIGSLSTRTPSQSNRMASKRGADGSCIRAFYHTGTWLRGDSTLTAFGEQLLPYAERLERAALDLAQQVANLDRDISGVVRLTCPDPIFYRLTGSPLLERFRSRYPAVKIEFIMSDAYLDLRQGQADVALRAGTDDDSRVGREIGASSWAIYASKSYLGGQGPAKDLQSLAAIGAIRAWNMLNASFQTPVPEVPYVGKE
jgi:DNA-binding transcriptional LysR family regulator